MVSSSPRYSHCSISSYPARAVQHHVDENVSMTGCALSVFVNLLGKLFQLRHNAHRLIGTRCANISIDILGLCRSEQFAMLLLLLIVTCSVNSFLDFESIISVIQSGQIQCRARNWDQI